MSVMSAASPEAGSAPSSEASAAATATRPQRLQHRLGQRAQSTSPQPFAPPRRWFLGPQRVNVFAVAACLLLVAGAVLVGIYGRPIDQLRLQPPADTAAAELLAFAQREHKRSGDPIEAEKECVTHSPGETVDTLRHDFGLDIDIPDFSSKGYQFDGLAYCDWHDEQVPKLKYRVPAAPGQRSPRFCIFISKNLDNLDCSSGRLPGCAKLGDHRVWQDHGLVYLMTACKPADLDQAYELLRGESSSSAR
jgi:hypothetical protein